MPKARFFTWYRVAPLAVVFVFGLISLVYSCALPLSLSRCIRLTTRRM